MDFGKEFKKYATKHVGIQSMYVDQYVDASLTPYIIEERQMNVAQHGRSVADGRRQERHLLHALHLQPGEVIPLGELSRAGQLAVFDETPDAPLFSCLCFGIP